MSQVFSVRLPDEVATRLRERARQTDDTLSALIVRFVDEGLRMEAHPGIAFRTGASGRRPRLLRGPDVWVVISYLHHWEATGDAAIRETADWFDRTEDEIRQAVAYYADFSDEIDEWIRLNDEAAEKLRRRLEAQERLIS